MSSTSKRRRQLAREKYERQQARRTESAQRAKRRNAAIASFLAVALVIGGVAFLALQTSDEPTTDPAAAATEPAATTSPEPGVSPTQLPCAYTKTGEAAKPVPVPTFDPAAAARPYTATLDTSQGAITFTADTAGAPCTSYSFRHLAENKFFDSTQCHRLSENETFGILQCGDPTATGQGGPGYQLPDENLGSLKDLTYPEGTVAMANSGANTNGSQFFFVYKKTTLPPSYTPFGKVTNGLDVLQKIAKGGIIPGPNSDTDGKPKVGVTITTVRISGM